jgi:serine/threonine protein kinase
MKLPARWKELSPLYDELIELDLAARAARLRAITQDEPGLVPELTAMLGAAAQVDERRFLSRRPSFDAVGAIGLRGRRIGPYLIVEELGHGGSGSVWKARHVDRATDDFVAIKLLHLSLLGRSAVARFQREGALLARLAHPAIVRLLDAGVTPEGQPWLALEHVDGLPIDQHCDANRVDLRGRMQLLHDVMDGVRHAHAEGIVHRDIKPGNILVTSQGQVKLLDFGIAKLLQAKPGDAPLTMDGQRVMTPRYAAPEQFDGAPVTPGTDVYSLGVLMYRLLVGRYPTSPDAATPGQVITSALTIKPARLASALRRAPGRTETDAHQIAASRDTTVGGLRRQVHGELDAIVGRALRRMADQRYASVAAFAADIARYLDGKPLSARAGAIPRGAARFIPHASALIVLSVVVDLIATMSPALWTARIETSGLVLRIDSAGVDGREARRA